MTQKLKVAEAYQDDVNSGIVRIDNEFLEKIDVRPGEAVGIRGLRETVALCNRAYPNDLGLGIIRMEGVMRKNVKIGVGESVEIFKPNLKDADKIILNPLSEIQLHPTTLSAIKKGLLGKPLNIGDIITIGKSRNDSRRVSFQSNSPFAIDLFNSIDIDFIGFNLGSIKFKVTSTKPTGCFLQITENTSIEISSKPIEENAFSDINYEDIGGLKSQLTKIRELVELPLKHPEIFLKLGIDAPKGILLYGPPGTGKTLLAKAIANESDASFYSISAPEIVNKYYGESEKKLRELFQKAEKDSPSIIFLDEIDAIAQKRDEVQGETEKRIVAQLLTLMDGLNKNRKVIVIAATNRPDTLDEALRRPGRFDRELEIGIPKIEDRFEILKIHTRGIPFGISNDFKTYEKEIKNFMNKHPNLKIDINKFKKKILKDKFEAMKILPEEIITKIKKKEIEKILKKISKVTHGFVGADLQALVKEAAFNVVRRHFPDIENVKSDEEIPQSKLNQLELVEIDFEESIRVIRPSALREFVVEVPNVKWEQIGGLENLKQELTEMIDWPLKNPQAFVRMGIKPSKGILLYGPPGTGKTLLAKAVASQTQSNFISIKGPEIINKYVGESEKTIRKIFQKARQNSPCILFFDEVDAIGKTRMGGNLSSTFDTIVTQILTEMDGLEDLINVKVIAATNRPNLLDPALLRPGRFDKLILVDIPNEKSREEILKIHIEKMPIEDKNSLIKKLSKKLSGYVGADIEALTREAGLIALRKSIKAKEVTEEDFLKATKVIFPSINLELQKLYKDIEIDLKNPKKEEEKLSMNSYI